MMLSMILTLTQNVSSGCVVLETGVGPVLVDVDDQFTNLY
jgi:hypothetical protein